MGKVNAESCDMTTTHPIDTAMTNWADFIGRYFVKSGATYKTSMNKLKDAGYATFRDVTDDDPSQVFKKLIAKNHGEPFCIKVLKHICTIVKEIEKNKKLSALFPNVTAQVYENFNKKFVKPVLARIKTQNTPSVASSQGGDVDGDEDEDEDDGEDEDDCEDEDENIDIGEGDEEEEKEEERIVNSFKKPTKTAKTVKLTKQLTKQLTKGAGTLSLAVPFEKIEEAIKKEQVLELASINVKYLHQDVKRLLAFVTAQDQKIDFLTSLLMPIVEQSNDSTIRLLINRIATERLSSYGKPSDLKMMTMESSQK